MKNQYFGDVNDFRKYGLLRTLQRASGLAVGVCWFLTIDDHAGDGERRNYLTNPAVGATTTLSFMTNSSALRR